MAITIEEHKLSPEARKAIKNAKSKSQFARDAIEFYVAGVKSGEVSNVGLDSEIILKELAVIKAMLSDNAKEPRDPKTEKTIVKTPSERREEKPVIVESVKEHEKTIPEKTIINDGFTEEQRREIEAGLMGVLNI